MNTELKQRLASYPLWTLPNDLANLMKDALAVIEQQEQQIGQLKRPKRCKLKIHIILNDKSTMIDCNDQRIAHGSDVRATLPFDQMRHTILREGNPDEVITDTMPVYTGDKLHTIPPCYGA